MITKKQIEELGWNPMVLYANGGSIELLKVINGTSYLLSYNGENKIYKMDNDERIDEFEVTVIDGNTLKRNVISKFKTTDIEGLKGKLKDLNLI